MKNFNMTGKMLFMSRTLAVITAVCLFTVSVFAAELPSSTPIPKLQPQTTIMLDKDINSVKI